MSQRRQGIEKAMKGRGCPKDTATGGGDGKRKKPKNEMK
jgi:hypothetical protein